MISIDWIEIKDTAIGALSANKLRSALMLLGIIIGVASVIIVVAIGTAGQKKIEKELETFGVNSVWVWRDYEGRKTAQENIWSSNNEISNKDVQAIKEYSSHLNNIAPVLYTSSKSSYRKEEKDVQVIGVTPAYQWANNEKLADGRFIADFDNLYLQKVCVLPFGTREDLLGNEANPIGKKIRLNKDRYIVVGVLEKKDRGFLETIRSVGGAGGHEVYIPLSVAQDWHKTKNINLLQGQALPSQSEQAVDEMKEVLTRRHGRSVKYKTETMEQYIRISHNIMGTLSLVLAIIAGISLFVGGLGIMNIMLVTVTERTREIGIRKAMGATKKEIALQFLLESILLSLIGGNIGIVLGMIGVGATAFLASVKGLLSWQPIFIAFFASAVVGILAGFYPAVRAANLDPIVALRYE